MLRPFGIPILLFSVSALALAQARPDKPRYAGPTDTGYLLPNGWHLTPVGSHLVTSDLPLNIHPLADGKHVLIATNGFNQHTLTLVNIAGTEPKLIQQEVSRNSWYGRSGFRISAGPSVNKRQAPSLGAIIVLDSFSC